MIDIDRITHTRLENELIVLNRHADEAAGVLIHTAFYINTDPQFYINTDPQFTTTLPTTSLATLLVDFHHSLEKVEIVIYILA
jgi:hypothetical protein